MLPRVTDIHELLLFLQLGLADGLLGAGFHKVLRHSSVVFPCPGHRKHSQNLSRPFAVTTF